MYLALCSQIKDNGPATRIWQPERWELAFFIWMISTESLVGRGWEDEIYRIKKNTTAPLPFHCLCRETVTLEVICTHILDKYLAGCAFPGIFTSPGGKEPCFSQAFGYSGSNFPWVLVTQQACLLASRRTCSSAPKLTRGCYSFHSSAIVCLQMGGSFLQKAKGSHCLEYPAFLLCLPAHRGA